MLLDMSGKGRYVKESESLLNDGDITDNKLILLHIAPAPYPP